MTKTQAITSVITGDIIRSRSTTHPLWLSKLKKTLSLEGKSPGTWQVYRGDSFQVEVKDPSRAFLTALRIKATIKTIKDLDVRMAIGIGQKNFSSSQVAESSGEAFIHSGQTFESLKKIKQTLAIQTPWPEFDRDMNVFFRLVSIPMDNWTTSSAELIQILVTRKDLTQKALARKLGVTQPSVSERRNRAHYDAVMELEELYREKVMQLVSK